MSVGGAAPPVLQKQQQQQQQQGGGDVAAAAGESIFERSGGFVYIRNFFGQRDYEVLLAECELLRAEVWRCRFIPL